MQAPFIPSYNLTLYLLPIVLFLCHSGHPGVIRTTTDGDKSSFGQNDQTFYIPNRTSSNVDEVVQESVSFSGFQSTTKGQPSVTTNARADVDKNFKSVSLKNTKKETATDNQRIKRTVASRSDLKYVDLVTHRNQLFLSKKDVFTETRHDPRGSEQSTLPSDFMMRIFECFTNSSCEHPRATMVRSFPNELNTGKVADKHFYIFIHFKLTLFSF